MKNIHILPTDKPSRLYYNTNAREYALSYTVLSQGGWVISQHIYITNDEIVKKYSNDLFLIDVYTGSNLVFSPIMINEETIKVAPHHTYMNDGKMCKKIILTTDQDLIKNGVQAIPDDFLEWFVKNPSCEEVEVIYGLYNPMGRKVSNEKVSENHSQCTWKYKIIIPKEEPKPYDADMKVDWSKFKKEKSKQETLEEALNKFKEEHTVLNLYPSNMLQNIAEFGAKWQQERMYGEEEVLELLEKRTNYVLNPNSFFTGVRQWFEQFKNK
jgi:hypothetical protein